MNLSLLLVPGVAFARGILGWLENSLKDGIVDLPEWKKLGETVIRMGVPMAALIWGLNIAPEVSAGIVVILDIVITKLYSALKK